ncbi:MAG: thiamine-phosphate kinase [Desulfobulbaceae bacterium]|nr:thiamine-phosphate kinase [Desulfobulbaceae bacterium]
MNERDIIEILSCRNSEGRPDLLRGIGDDCAVIAGNGGQSWLVTMDTLVEDVHFDLRWHPPDKLGRKAIAVNVSDIAAMGGRPAFIFLSLGLPRQFDSAWLDRFAEGISGACREYGCVLAGGDTVRSREGVLLTVTVIGQMPADQVVYRSGALPGDEIWVSGTLGRAAAGLELCAGGGSQGDEGMKSLVEAHLDPQPRVVLGRLLAEHNVAHAMMDLSDGLATDLSHLCGQSGVGADVYAASLPSLPALHDAADLLKKNPLDLMIKGGEDYELIFTAAAAAGSRIAGIARQAGVILSRVGTIVHRQGVRLIVPAAGESEQKEVDISFAGFDHFPQE